MNLLQKIKEKFFPTPDSDESALDEMRLRFAEECFKSGKILVGTYENGKLSIQELIDDEEGCQ